MQYIMFNNAIYNVLYIMQYIMFDNHTPLEIDSRLKKYSMGDFCFFGVYKGWTIHFENLNAINNEINNV